ncbi:unnamed protein product [Rotaria magnacalcarata]
MLFQNAYRYPIQPSMTTNKMPYQSPATTYKSNISNVPLKTAFASKVLWITLSIVIVLGLVATTTVSIVVTILTLCECTTWNSFIAGLTCSSHTSLNLYGTNGSIGVDVTNAAVATAIASALRTGTAYSGSSNGHSWQVGTCGTGIELTATGATYSCNPGYIIRPCVGNSN